MELRKKIEEAIGRVFSVAGWRSDPLERDCAAAALSAIEEAGFVMVPAGDYIDKAVAFDMCVERSRRAKK